MDRAPWSLAKTHSPLCIIIKKEFYPVFGLSLSATTGLGSFFFGPATATL